MLINSLVNFDFQFIYVFATKSLSTANLNVIFFALICFLFNILSVYLRLAEYGGVAKNFRSLRSVVLPTRILGVPIERRLILVQNLYFRKNFIKIYQNMRVMKTYCYLYPIFVCPTNPC